MLRDWLHPLNDGSIGVDRIFVRQAQSVQVHSIVCLVSNSSSNLTLALPEVPIPVRDGLLQFGSHEAAPLRAQQWYTDFAAWFSDAVGRDHGLKIQDRIFSSSVGAPSSFNMWTLSGAAYVAPDGQ